MTENFAPADVETVSIALCGGPDQADTNLPSNHQRGQQWTRVRRQGGNRTNLILSAARLTVECWGATDKAAFDLAASRWAAFAAAEGTVVDGVWIALVELTEPANYPDDDGSPRYQFVVGLTTNLMRSTT